MRFPANLEEVDLTRRSIVLSGLGSVALGACGGGGGQTISASPSPSGSSTGNAPAPVPTPTPAPGPSPSPSPSPGPSPAGSPGGGSSSGFVHPGLLSTQADFERMAAKVAAGASPWIGGWNRLIANPHASLSYAPNPQVVVSRGNDGVHPDNSAALFNDAAAAYQCALRWKVSGNTACADKAVQIMNAWSSTLTAIYGNTALNGDMDGVLMAGIQGYQFANAGEIMRTYPGWAAVDFAAFQRMMSGLFYPVNHQFITATGGLDPILIYSNWDLCSIASILAIGVLCDDQAKFDEAITYFESGRGNGAIAQMVYYLHPGHLGQTQESGRDQGHDTLSAALLSVICEMAWNQGVDLYGYRNNLALSAFEYVARGNLIASGTTYYTVPYTTYRNHQVTDTVFASAGQGTQRPHWSIAYHHFANRLGIAAPYSKAFALLMSPEGGGGDYGTTSGGFDQLGFTTLTHWRDPIASGAAPSGLTARLTGGAVQLSWWGGVYADSYSVERSSAAAGPYTTIASGITDPRTWTDTPAPGPWYYRVRQSVAGVDGEVSNVAKVQTALTPLLRLAMNEGGGTVAADGTGNGLHGTLTGGTSWTTGPKAGTQAVAFDGSSGSIVLPADFTEDLGDFTIATWA
ncbi:MAG TPA: alginate lyase family protein, partial [Rhizomicrobium sp.]|nr:alginate lyase family protein [Rhizomicrobium sp.]